MVDKKSVRTRVLSAVLTIAIIALLLAAGPAEAFTLSLIPDRSSVQTGESITFTASLDIESGERLPVEYLELVVGGEITCRFSPSGEKISGCASLTIEPMVGADYTEGSRQGEYDGAQYNFGYGYGYGYGYGSQTQKLSYNLTLDTTAMSPGEYTTTLRAKMALSSEVFESEDGTITIHGAQTFTLDIESPVDGIINTRRVPFNLTTTEQSSKIYYLNFDDNIPREKLLCRNCDSYGESRRKLSILREGWNHLAFRAMSEAGDLASQNIMVFVDSIGPQIRKTLPVRGFTSGIFTVEFAEENVANVTLRYGNARTGFRDEVLDVSEDCVKGARTYVCVADVDLSDYDLEDITYTFKVTDIAGNNTTSRSLPLSVDVTSPVVISFDGSLDGKRATFTFRVNDTNFERITYVDSADPDRVKTLCTSLRDGICSKTVVLEDGAHEITFNITDEAGNSVEQNYSVFIDSSSPRILRTEPLRESVDGRFYVEFHEDNPVDLVLHYGNIQTGMAEEQFDLENDCTKVRSKGVCERFIDLSPYDGQMISYWFELTDVADQSDVSRTRTVDVELI